MACRDAISGLSRFLATYSWKKDSAPRKNHNLRGARSCVMQNGELANLLWSVMVEKWWILGCGKAIGAMGLAWLG